MEPPSRYDFLAGWLREALEATGMTQKDLAIRSGVSDRTISALINAERDGYRLNTLRRIGEALGDPHIIEQVLEDPSSRKPTDLTYRTADDHRAQAEDEIRELEDRARGRILGEQVVRSIHLAGITSEVLTRLGWHPKFSDDPEVPDILAIRPGGQIALVAEVKAINPGNEMDAITSALGQIVLYMLDLEEDDGDVRPVIVTDYPLREELLARLEKQGIRHAWPGDWSAVEVTE